MIGFDMTQKAAKKLFQKTGLKPDDVDVIELHDCFSANELITYEALGLCPIGKVSDYYLHYFGGRVLVFRLIADPCLIFYDLSC